MQTEPSLWTRLPTVPTPWPFSGARAPTSMPFALHSSCSPSRGLECREVLALIKSDVDLKSIPTIVLGTSDAASDIVKCYDLKANWYMSKPEHYDGFARLVGLLIDFWLTTAQRPSVDAVSGARSA